MRERFPSSGPKATLMALHAAGFTSRTYGQVRSKARRLGLKYHRPRPKQVSAEEARPVVPRSRRGLYELAETPGLTLTEYHRRKAQILKEEA